MASEQYLKTYRAYRRFATRSHFMLRRAMLAWAVILLVWVGAAMRPTSWQEFGDAVSAYLIGGLAGALVLLFVLAFYDESSRSSFQRSLLDMAFEGLRWKRYEAAVNTDVLIVTVSDYVLHLHLSTGEVSLPGRGQRFPDGMSAYQATKAGAAPG